jgi:hypothetical protein
MASDRFVMHSSRSVPISGPAVLLVKDPSAPVHHIDPTRPEGILSYRTFGWDVLDEIRMAGFREASIDLLFGPFHGYMTLGEPLVVASR